MLFVLGLFLVSIGIMLMMTSETRTTYIYFGEIPVPSGTETVHPYADGGLVVILAGITSLVIGFVQSKKEEPADQDAVHRPQIVEHESPLVQ
jgi:hypothetical protein